MSAPSNSRAPKLDVPVDVEHLCKRLAVRARNRADAPCEPSSQGGKYSLKSQLFAPDPRRKAKTVSSSCCAGDFRDSYPLREESVPLPERRIRTVTGTSPVSRRVQVERDRRSQARVSVLTSRTCLVPRLSRPLQFLRPP